MKYLFGCIIFWFLLMGITCMGFTQTQNLKFEHLTIEDGLSHNSVACIIEDKKGYLWFGTNDGLNRYDGYNFKVYKFNPGDTTSLPHNGISELWNDSEGNIWIGAGGVGLIKFDPSTEKFTEYKPKLNKATYRSISAIYEDSEGMMWVGTWEGLLHRFNKQTGEFSQNFDFGFKTLPDSLKMGFSHDAVLGMFKDRSGTLWIGTLTGLHKLNLTPGKASEPSQICFTHYQHDPKKSNSLGGRFASNIYEDRAGMLWINSAGLNRFDRKTNTFTRYQHDPKNPNSILNGNLTYIAEDKQGNLWISTNEGLSKLNKERTQFSAYRHDKADPSSLSSNLISSLLIDKSGTLWVGTVGEGINKASLKGENFTLYRHNSFNPNSLSDKAVTAIWEDRKGILWIGTHNGGLNRIDRKTGKFTHYRNDPANPKSLWLDYITDILEDQDENFWICHPNKISKFNRSSGEFEHSIGNKDLDRILNQNRIYSIYEDEQGIIWVGTEGGLIQFNRKTNHFIHYQHNPANTKGIGDYQVQTVREDSRGNLWIGHGSLALTKLNKKTGRFTWYKTNKRDSTSISSVFVKTIYEDSKGDIWFGTVAGGLCRYNYKEDNFTTFTENQGLSNNTIYSIQEDNQRHLWLGTNKGLSRFSLTSYTFTNYDINDGLQSNQFAGGNLDRGACFKGKDGTLYFGGSNGFNAFNPEMITPNTYIPPVVITAFRLFDKPVPGKNEARKIILNHDQNFFSFEFAALNFSNSLKNQYAYTLEGLEPNWVYSGTRRLASYTDVGPGTYTFKVKGSNNDGIWNARGSSIQIIIKPPWWQTWWAYGFYFLCFMASVFAVDRFQRKRLIQKEREKAREKELEQAHELEKAYHQLKQTQAELIQKEKMASLGELTAGIAHEIQNPLNFVNNFSEVSLELLDDMQLELVKGDTKDALTLAMDVQENLRKIIHHGQRSDAIVKSMLQHSRASTGEKQLTDINALTDEYLRLAYHGLRAKNKEFNANLITDFDNTIGKVEVVPQELGRVLLNLFNNAFYATHVKKAQLNGQYQPEVIVSTHQQNGKLEVRVRDNGTGIPESIKNKIFQPFFTTKPTGQGTGLGLSLSYDIVKALGGEIKVETQVGEFTEFTVQLNS